MARSYGLKDFLLFFEAWVLLAVARLILVFVPFKKIIPLMGKQVDNASQVRSGIANVNLLQKLEVAILRGSRYSPWRSMCFEQALAAKMMLKRRKFVSSMFFGVYKNDDNPTKLLAHAWLICDGFIVTGGKNINHYTVLSVFES